MSSSDNKATQVAAAIIGTTILLVVLVPLGIFLTRWALGVL